MHALRMSAIAEEADQSLYMTFWEFTTDQLSGFWLLWAFSIAKSHKVTNLWLRTTADFRCYQTDSCIKALKLKLSI